MAYMNWQDMTPSQQRNMIRLNNQMKKQAEEDEKLGKPLRGLREALDYLTPYTGGSIRHKNIRAVDCQQALYDLNRDWKKYHEAKLELELKKLRKKFKK